jgi:hypothetical protein
MPIDDGFLRRLRAIPEDRIVTELKKIHARRTTSERPANAAAPLPAPGSETRYERARRVFADEEKRLRQQALLTEQVVDQLRAREQPAPSPHGSQETLLLRAAAGRPAVGRFRLVNRFARTVPVELSASTLRRRDGAGDVPCPVTVTPPQVVLDPGADQVIRVAIDVGAARVPLGAGTILEGQVVARAGAATVHRLWLEVEIYDLPAAEPEEMDDR